MRCSTKHRSTRYAIRAEETDADLMAALAEVDYSHLPRQTPVVKFTVLAAALTLTACAPEPKRIVEALPIPPERMDCQPAGTRPSIPPEYVIVWENVRSVLDAKAEHDKYVGSVRTREGVVAGYVLKLEGNLWACGNDAQWLREWQDGINRDGE